MHVLPRMTAGFLLAVATSMDELDPSLNTSCCLREYWLHVHGIRLPQEFALGVVAFNSFGSRMVSRALYCDGRVLRHRTHHSGVPSVLPLAVSWHFRGQEP